MSIFKKLFSNKNKGEKVNPIQFYSFPISSIIRETDKAVSLVFEKPEENFDFLPGQYLTLKTTIDGEEQRRAYSLCNLPNENQLKVTVKETPDGYFSKYVNQNLKVGDLLDVLPPQGKFTFEADSTKKRKIVAFAGGSGITPISSIAQSILKNEPESSLTLFYGNRRQSEIIFQEFFKNLEKEYPTRFKLIHVISDESPSDFTKYYGYIDSDKVSTFATNYFKPTAVDQFYLCGPGEMISIITDSLLGLNIEKSKIKAELFTVPLTKIDNSENKENAENGANSIQVGGTITAKYSFKEKTVPYSDKKKTVLDAALDAGMEIPFSCLNGVCSTCSARITKGTVKMDQNFALEQEDLDAGYVLTCQSRPTSKEVTVDWDDNRI